jgi:hypothetical protein
MRHLFFGNLEARSVLYTIKRNRSRRSGTCKVFVRRTPAEWTLLLVVLVERDHVQFYVVQKSANPIQNQPIFSLKKLMKSMSQIPATEFCRPLQWSLQLLPPNELGLAPIAEAATGD